MNHTNGISEDMQSHQQMYTYDQICQSNKVKVARPQ